ncbi:cation:proton antiporter, partial [Aetokthonos hydrillicola]|uniref:cation:proton antiporter n=1 Tax=Aetokthonos hydrillicola TaxID=1550245 RepID=UPI001ABA31BE
FTLISAYATYLITDDLGGSAVIGVVTTGLILGNFGSRIGMSSRTRIIISEFWEFLAFFVNSIVFLLIGDQVRFADLGENLPIIAVTVVAMILMRAIAILSLSKLSDFVQVQKIPFPDQIILWWSGLRGSVSIALALSVPTILPERHKIIATVFGVVLFTLLFQGLSIKPLLQQLNLLGDQPLRQRYLELNARIIALNSTLQYLQANQRPRITLEVYHSEETLIKEAIEQLRAEIEQLQQEYPSLQSFALEQQQEELLEVEVDSYAQLVRRVRLNKEFTPFLQKVLGNVR